METMSRPPAPCPVFSPCWCEVAGRQNNPHCKGVDSLPVENDNMQVVIVILILIIVCRKIFK